MPEHIVRVWFKNSTFVDVPESQIWEYANDPDFDCTESLDDISTA